MRKELLGFVAASVVPVLVAAALNGGVLFLVALLAMRFGTLTTSALHTAVEVAQFTVTAGGAVWVVLCLVVGTPVGLLLQRTGSTDLQAYIVAGAAAGTVLAALVGLYALLVFGFDPFLLLSGVDGAIAAPLAGALYWAVARRHS